MQNRTPKEYKFGTFRLDVKSYRLVQNGKPVALTPKSFETLFALVKRRGEMLTKDELLDEIWKDTFVEEVSLARNISVLRKIFGAENFIETVPRLGYRFTAEVEEIFDEDSADGRDTLAVLPFKIFSGEADDEFLGIGLTDVLITRLSNLHKIVVRPTSAVLRFQNLDEELPKIGEKLKVAMLLDGRIHRSLAKLRVTVQLIRTADGTNLWGDKFDADLTDIFTLQDTISEEVVRALTLKLKDAEKVRLSARFTENNFAYQNYLQGRFFWNKRTTEGFFKAIEFFNRAIDEDPLFALAYTGIADCWNMLGYFTAVRPAESYPKAKFAARKALEIDAKLAEAHSSLACALMFYDWDFTEAEREFKSAIACNPNYPTAHQWFALCLAAQERFDEALSELEIAQNLDPLSLIIHASRGLTSFFAGDFDRMISENQKILEMDAGFTLSYYELGLAFTEKKMFEEAISAMEKVVELTGESPRMSAHLGSTYAASGNVKEAEIILRNLLKEAQKDYVSPLDIAMIYARLDKKDEAFEWLEKSFEEREGNLIYMKVDPEFDSLRSDARFKKMLGKIGLDF